MGQRSASREGSRGWQWRRELLGKKLGKIEKQVHGWSQNVGCGRREGGRGWAGSESCWRERVTRLRSRCLKVKMRSPRGWTKECLQGGMQGSEWKVERKQQERLSSRCVEGQEGVCTVWVVAGGREKGVGWKQELLGRKRHLNSAASTHTPAYLWSPFSHTNRLHCYCSNSSGRSGIAPPSAP